MSLISPPVSEFLEMPNARNTFDLSVLGIMDFEVGLRSILETPGTSLGIYTYDRKTGRWELKNQRKKFEQTDISRTSNGLVFRGYGEYHSGYERYADLYFLLNGAPKFAFLENLKNPFSSPGIYLASQVKEDTQTHGTLFPLWRACVGGYRNEFIIFPFTSVSNK